MKYPIVSLHCFQVVGLSITAAFEPVINMEYEAIIGGFTGSYSMKLPTIQMNF